jgi:hypothetical protein
MAARIQEKINAPCKDRKSVPTVTAEHSEQLSPEPVPQSDSPLPRSAQRRDSFDSSDAAPQGPELRATVSTKRTYSDDFSFTGYIEDGPGTDSLQPGTNTSKRRKTHTQEDRLHTWSPEQSPEVTSTAGDSLPTDTLTEGVSNPNSKIRGDVLRSEYESKIGSLTQEIKEVIKHRPKWLHKSDPLMQYYLEYINIYDYHGGGDGLYAPMATFGRDSELQQPQGTTAAQVLCASPQQLRAAMSSAVGLADIPCIYIPKEEQEVLPSLSDFTTELQGWKHTTLEYQQFSRKNAKKTGHMPISDFRNRLDERRSNASIPTLLDAGAPPHNFLDISGSKLELYRRPTVLDTLKLRLLDRTGKWARAQSYRGPGALGKEYAEHCSTSKLQHVDLESCLKFVLYGERGAASGYHMDVLNGTWIQVLSGFKLWFVPTRPITDQEASQFGEKGIAWDPPVDLFRAVLLCPGDMLIMRPGYFTPHFVVTGQDSLMMGGMEWTAESVPSVLEQLKFIIPRYNSTNESVPGQLTQVLDVLPSLLPEYADKVKEFTEWLKGEELLHCSCGHRCNQSCVCRRISTHRGCTSWCHDGKIPTACVR